MNWKQYEQKISDHFHSEYPGSRIAPNATLIGRFSKVPRQIDLLVEDHLADFVFRIVIDAKHRNRKIDVNDVEAFLGLLRDVSAHQGVMISNKGYSKAAINRAHYDDLDLDLEVLNFSELQMLHGFGAIAHAGGFGVAMPAPFGWVIDAARRKEFVACLYQRGLDFDQAVHANEWMYINFWIKNERTPDLQSLINQEENSLRTRFPSAGIQYIDSSLRSDAQTRIRALSVETYPAPEFTGFVEFKQFIFFCVLFTPKEVEGKNLRKLRYILRRVVPCVVKHKDSNANNAV